MVEPTKVATLQVIKIFFYHSRLNYPSTNDNSLMEKMSFSTWSMYAVVIVNGNFKKDTMSFQT